MDKIKWLQEVLAILENKNTRPKLSLVSELDLRVYGINKENILFSLDFIYKSQMCGATIKKEDVNITPSEYVNNTLSKLKVQTNEYAT